MSDLVIVLAGIAQDHAWYRHDGPRAINGRCNCSWHDDDPGLRDMTYREHTEHVAAVQTAWLREHLAEHAEELGLIRETNRYSGVVTWTSPKLSRYVTDWSRDE